MAMCTNDVTTRARALHIPENIPANHRKALLNLRTTDRKSIYDQLKSDGSTTSLIDTRKFLFDFAKENLQSDHDAISSTTVVSDLKLKMRKSEHMVSSLCDDILDFSRQSKYQPSSRFVIPVQEDRA